MYIIIVTVDMMVAHLLSTESYNEEVRIHMRRYCNEKYVTDCKSTSMSKDVAEDLAQWEKCYENMCRIIAERHKDLRFNMYR